MPLEIKELETNLNMTDGSADGGVAPQDMKASIIEECIEQILQILKDQKEL